MVPRSHKSEVERGLFFFHLNYQVMMDDDDSVETYHVSLFRRDGITMLWSITKHKNHRHIDMVDWTQSVLMRYLIYQLDQPTPSSASSASTNPSTRPCAPCSIRPRTTNDARVMYTHVVNAPVFVPLLTISIITEQPATVFFLILIIDILIRLYQFRTVVLVRLWYAHSPLSVSVRASVLLPSRGGPRVRWSR